MDNGIHFSPAGLTIDGCLARELAHIHGTPLFVYSMTALRDAWQRLRDAFPLPTRLCYALKANGLRPLLRELAELGAGFDLVSGGEMRRLQAAGLGDREVVFSGVGKEPWEIALALELPGLLFFNVESPTELECIEAVAATAGKIAPVALRLNLDIEVDSHAYLNTSVRQVKFGIDPVQARTVARRVAASPHLRLVGYHLHLGSLVGSPEPYLRAVERLLAFHEELGLVADPFFDLGGGFAVPLAPGGEVFPFADYARRLGELLTGRSVRLVLEPGRSLVGESGLFLVKVIRSKESGGRRFEIVDGGMNDFMRPCLYQAKHLVWPVDGPEPPAGGGIPEGGVDVVGPICESGDFLGLDRELPPLREGQVLALFCAGAYGESMSSRYNSRRAAAQVVVDRGRHRVARAREEFEALWEGED